MSLARERPESSHVEQRWISGHRLVVAIGERLPLVVIGQSLTVAPVVVRLGSTQGQDIQQRRTRRDPIVYAIDAVDLACSGQLKKLLFRKGIERLCRRIALQPGVFDRWLTAGEGVDAGAHRCHGLRADRRRHCVQTTLGQGTTRQLGVYRDRITE
jgi:hypothetical protein